MCMYVCVRVFVLDDILVLRCFSTTTVDGRTVSVYSRNGMHSIFVVKCCMIMLCFARISFFLCALYRILQCAVLRCVLICSISSTLSRYI